MLGAWQVKYIISSFKVYFVILYKYLRQEKFSNGVRGSANAVYIVHGGYRLLQVYEGAGLQQWTFYG